MGIVIYNLSFNFRETHGYNIFIFPLYIILASIILNKLEKRFVIIFYLLLSINFLSETISLSGLHKNHFIREPRVYDLCGIEKWKNSENYKENFDKSSYISLIKNPTKWYFNYRLPRFDDRFLMNYCDQMKNKTNF